MKSTNPYSIHPKHLQNAKTLRRAKTSDAAGTPTPPPTASTIRTAGRAMIYLHMTHQTTRDALGLMVM